MNCSTLPVSSVGASGTSQTFAVPVNGWYEIELWGAQAVTPPGYVG